MSNKPDVQIRWCKREQALLYVFQSNAGKAMGSIISRFLERCKQLDIDGMRHNPVSARIRANDAFGRAPDPEDEMTLAQILDSRGYDLTTLRFLIRKKATPP